VRRVSDEGGIGSATEPSVDIGLTAYRRTTYLAEAIESVVAQTFQNWRLTVCDNGPGGGAIEDLTRSYLSDARVTYLATRRELPLAENWTNALSQGTGRYVAVLNDDDRYHPDFLRRRVDALEAHPECAFAYAEWVGIDEHGAVTQRVPPKFPEGVLLREVMAEWFTRQNLVVPPAIIVRRAACEHVGAFFDSRWQYCDWELWARLAAHYPAYYLTEPDNDFRRHSGAYTFSDRESADHLLEMLEHIEALFMREVESFRPSRLTRARNRSRMLLHIAGDAHRGGGWKASRGLYGRALRVYPPTFFAYPSISMVGRTILGKSGSRVLSKALRFVRRDGEATASSPRHL
jgi:glycosyltransferase involved in cell wall biosynthesis